MKTYQTSMIYKIYDIKHPDQFYIGSTSYKYLSQRIAVHRCKSHYEDRKNMKLYQYVNNNVGWDRMKIELVELINRSTTIDELRQIEGKYIRTLNPPLNKNIAGRGAKEYNSEVIECPTCHRKMKRFSKSQHNKTQIHLQNNEVQQN